ncbi:helix-turn-helix transcriptional regulator [Xanthobacter sp. V13C-7B]|uniref:helix-turn-helix domain-containing protein n=1 Tax=Xanthobacter variabilis TaxID=3119932 RepID=UPI003729AEAF
MPRLVTDTDISIGHRLRKIRQQRGVTAERLAEMLDLSFQQVGKYEQGLNRLTLSRAIAICEALSVPLDMLAYGRGVDDCVSSAPLRRRRVTTTRGAATPAA